MNTRQRSLFPVQPSFPSTRIYTSTRQEKGPGTTSRREFVNSTHASKASASKVGTCRVAVGEKGTLPLTKNYFDQPWDYVCMCVVQNNTSKTPEGRSATFRVQGASIAARFLVTFLEKKCIDPYRGDPCRLFSFLCFLCFFFDFYFFLLFIFLIIF